MLFYSFEFMYLFLPVALGGYYLFGNIKRHLAVKWVVVCSLFFYGWWNPYYLIFLGGSLLFNYYSGLVLRKARHKFLLAFSILINLGFIGYFKYAGFFASILTDLSGTLFLLNDIVLPLGISFFTFQQISWLIDNYSGRISDQDRGLWEYGQFVVFFPQLIAGPIVHHSQMMPQFYEEKNRVVNWQHMAMGISIFVVGLAKKVVIADSAAPYSNMVFEGVKNGSPVGFMDAWIGALAYTVQIYFDFSGYADMAIGLALMFNIHLPLNFNSPYKSVSIAEFWRRWHMTLGAFLRDYVYIPLGGSHCRQLRNYTNLLATLFLCGVWHGAGWTFILWGVLHGIFLMIHRAWSRLSPLALPRFMAVGLTFVCVVFAWVLFRAHSLADAWVIVNSMLWSGSFQALITGEIPELIKGLYVVIPALLIGFFLPNSQTLFLNVPQGAQPQGNSVDKANGGEGRSFFPGWYPNWYWTGYVMALCLISVYFLVDQTTVREFIYFQF